MPTSATKQLNYNELATTILATLRNERDRQIVARRYGLGLDKRHTLEKIGADFNITRERVRQIEKTATVKLQQSNTSELGHIDGIFKRHLESQGRVSRLGDVATAMGAEGAAEQAYIAFLALLAPSIEVIDDSDRYHAALALRPEFDKKRIGTITDELIRQLKATGKPTRIDSLHQKLKDAASRDTIEQIAKVSKQLSHLDEHWGLSHWPEVNPRSIRDKTYLVLVKHTAPLHFSDIAKRISSLGANKRDVTVQAVHNELIKDPRFVLVGRGIYALSEWGYSPGTVADIISDVLKRESPLHKNEIVRRVLEKRHVKTTTIVLNLQEKDKFVRVAKATYALK